MKKKRREIKTSNIKEKDKDGRPILSLYEHDSVSIKIDDDKRIFLEPQDAELEQILRDREIDINTYLSKDKTSTVHIDAGKYITAIPLSNFIILVNPKFSNIQSIGRLIHYASGFKEDEIIDGQINFLEGRNQGLEFHIEQLIHYTKKILKEGLYRTYVSIQEDIPYLKGKLLLLPTETTSGQLLNDARFNLQFSCEHDEFTANIRENQILLFTLDVCQRKTESHSKKIEIQRLIHEIDYEVEMPAPVTSDTFHNLQYTTINQRYKNSLVCCEKILNNFGLVNLKKQNTEFISPFFINMSELFQDFIARLLKNPDYYPHYTKEDKRGKRETSRIAWNVAGANQKIRPDIITFTDPACDLNDYSKIHSIIDAKYKNDSEEEGKGTLAEDDMYQIAFYLNDFQKRIGYAVLPQHDNSRDDYEIKAINQGLVIKVRHIPIDKTLKCIFEKSDENTKYIHDMIRDKFLI